jgi:hypothetical protein
MDSKLQQAIVATRAGEHETAQLLLTEALKEHPQDAGAWFLLAHLVESPERQARYLEFTLTLEPDHAVAAEHLKRLLTADIPLPIFKDEDSVDVTSTHPTPPPTIDSEFVPIPPARTNAVVTASNVTDISPLTPISSGPQVVKEQDSKRIDTEWQLTAGTPKRATASIPVSQGRPRSVPAAPVQPKRAPVAPSRQSISASPSPAATRKQSKPPNKWLLAILLVMVAATFFVLSFLAYTIFFR